MAMVWYRLSASQGNPNAQFNLGCSYDPWKKQHAYWIQMGAYNGDDKAREKLATLYKSGRNKWIPKDAQKAKYWSQYVEDESDSDSDDECELSSV